MKRGLESSCCKRGNISFIFTFVLLIIFLTVFLFLILSSYGNNKEIDILKSPITGNTIIPYSSSQCGNNICEVDEEPLGVLPCARDCVNTCGANGCELFETKTSCSVDCTISKCGDNYCDIYNSVLSKRESPTNCPYDCARRCGNNKCESPETYVSCPLDCSPSCGNDVCEINEKYSTCPQDCTISRCGDTSNLCQPSVGENEITCPYDCAPRCGNKKCDVNETYIETHESCLSDCPWAELGDWKVYSPGKLIPQGYNINGNSITISSGTTERKTMILSKYFFPGDNLSLTFQNRTSTQLTFSIEEPSLSSYKRDWFAIDTYYNGRVGSYFDQGHYAGNYGTFYCYLTGFINGGNEYFYNPITFNGESITDLCASRYSSLRERESGFGVVPHSIIFSFLSNSTKFSISPPYHQTLYAPPFNPGQTGPQVAFHHPSFPLRSNGKMLNITVSNIGGAVTIANISLQSSCGNNKCETPENSTNCPNDCSQIIPPPTPVCIDNDNDKYNQSATGCGITFDCDDSNATIKPGISEVCNDGIDNNCVNGIDEGCLTQVCNNNLREGNEVCDRTDLNGQTCLSKGYDGGILLCNSNCNGFITSSCTICQLTGAFWGMPSAVENQTINLRVTGTNCNGKTISFNVFEKDYLDSDDASLIKPINATFNGNTATTTWKAEWQCDGDLLGLGVCVWGNPQYYFVASINSTRTIKSGSLTVQRATAVCGDNITQTGEECDDGNKVSEDGCSSSCQVEINSCQGITQCKNYTNEINCNNNICSVGNCLWYKKDVNKCVLNVDNDKDNVPNEIDKCLHTPIGFSSSRINKYGCILPFYSKFTSSLTTNFTGLDDLTKVKNLSLGIQDKGRIFFVNQEINATDKDFDSNVNIIERKIYVNSTALPILNKTATLNFYNIKFTTPGILRDGVNCSLCKDPMYLNDIYSVSVPGFSEYEVIDTYVQPQTPQGGNGGGGGGGGDDGAPDEETNITDCIPFWECTQWEISKDGTYKTRICVDKKKCSLNIKKPAQYESVSCNENWVCEEWSNINKNKEKCGVRNCADSNNCGTYNNRPDTELKCAEKNPNTPLIIFIILGLIIIAIIFVIFKISKVRKRKIENNRD